MIDPSASLTNLHVMVTRPAHQAAYLCDQIQQRGGMAFNWPVLEIIPLPLNKQLTKIIDQIDRYDRVIFISANAVTLSFDLMPELQDKLRSKTLYAVGKATAKSLSVQQMHNIRFPQTASSQGLLMMDDFSIDQINNKRCLIFRGLGGNEILAKELLARGAHSVDYAQTYQRIKPVTDPETVIHYSESQQLDIILITSCEGLRNLFAMMGKENHSMLLTIPLLTVSQRVAEYAQESGYKNQIVLARSANDDDIVEALHSWWNSADNGG